LRERLIDRVEPRLVELIDELFRVALHGVKDADRLKAIDMLLNQAIGKAPEVIELVGDRPTTAHDLLDAWREAQK
jgi:hypothetical protein